MEMRTAAIPAAIPAAEPQASAPCAPCPSSVAPATRATETTTAMTTSIDDGGRSVLPAAGCAASRKTARPPVVRAAPSSSSRSGACWLRTARRPRATTRAAASIGCTTATGATARAATCDPVPSMVDGLAEHPSPPPHQLAQAQPGRRLAEIGRLVHQHRAHREQHRRQRREQQAGGRAPGWSLCQRLHGSGMPHRSTPRTGPEDRIRARRRASGRHLRSPGMPRRRSASATRPGGTRMPADRVERVTRDKRNVTAASGGTVDWQRRPRAFRPIPTRDRGDAPGRRGEHRRDRHPLLHTPVRRTSRTARRRLQPRQPGREDPADGPRRLRGRVRQLPGADARAAARAPALPDRAQARVARHHPGPVRRRPRPPVLGDRRRARRRRDARGRRRVGRGLLADGLRPDQPGAWPLQRPRRAAGDGLARVGGRREDPGDRGRRDVPAPARPTTAWCGRRCPAST